MVGISAIWFVGDGTMHTIDRVKLRGRTCLILGLLEDFKFLDPLINDSVMQTKELEW